MRKFIIDMGFPSCPITNRCILNRLALKTAILRTGTEILERKRVPAATRCIVEKNWSRLLRAFPGCLRRADLGRRTRLKKVRP